MHIRIYLSYSKLDRVDTIAGQYAASGDETAVLPIGEPKFGTAKGILTVYPAGEAVSYEWSVDSFQESLLV